MNRGCIPTKALLNAAATRRAINSAKPLGVNLGSAWLGFPMLVTRSRQVDAQLSKGVRQLLGKHKITVITGEAMTTPESTLLQTT